MPITKLFLGMIFFVLLCACQQQPLTYDELMQHPDRLQAEVQNCSMVIAATQTCQMVKQAETDFQQLVSDRSQAPAKFGQQILDLQTELATLKDQPQQQEKYQQDATKLKILYAVVVATSRGE